MSIYNLLSNIELEEDIKDSFGIRKINQKLLYLQKGAKLFYKEKKSDSLYGIYDLNENSLDQLSIKNYFLKEKKTSNVFISLGCGNSFVERFIFEYLMSSEALKIDYIGVDSSIDMLNMSLDIFSNTKFKSKLLCVDFFSKKFKKKIQKLTKNYTNKVYCMFGNIFGNLNPTKSISMFNNVLEYGDLLWLDVRLKKGDSVGDDLKLFNHYCKYLRSPDQVNFFSNIFWQFGIPKDNFYLYVSTSKDPVLDSLRFDFSAKFTKKTIVNILGDKFIILPKESIQIVDIYAYSYHKLIDFFNEHGFELKKILQNNGRGHFILKKVN